MSTLESVGHWGRGKKDAGRGGGWRGRQKKSRSSPVHSPPPIPHSPEESLIGGGGGWGFSNVSKNQRNCEQRNRKKYSSCMFLIHLQGYCGGSLSWVCSIRSVSLMGGAKEPRGCVHSVLHQGVPFFFHPHCSCQSHMT